MSIENEFVKNWMTADPFSVDPSMHLTKADELMKETDIRRLPVVEDGKLIGIVTDGDIREAGPSDMSSLSQYDTNFLLSGLSVKDVMSKDPITVSPDDTIRVVAKKMLDNKIGGIPVLEESKLVGIVTVSDIFKVVMNIFEE